MKKNIILSLFLVILFVPHLGLAAQRIFYEDCEATVFDYHFLERSYGTHYQDYWNQMLQSISRSTLAPHGGNYCATWDPWVSRTFGTTMGIGNVKYGNTSNFDISAALQGKNSMYIRYWMRWQQDIDYDGSVEHKILYVNLNGIGDFVLTIKKCGPKHFHITGKSQSPYTLRENTWVTYNGYNIDDMNWHKIEVYMNWAGIGSTGKLLFKIDDIVVLDRNNWYYRDSDEEGSDIQVICVPSNISGSSSGNAVEWWDDIEIWDGLPNSEDDNCPTVQISIPTSQETFLSSDENVTLAGSAADENGIAIITWVNNRGGSGTANNDSGDWTSWSVSNIPLQEGENVITVTATDTAGQTGTDTLIVTYSPPGDTTPPTIQITGPTSESTYETNSSTINLIGTASDNVVVSEVTWENSAGGTGTASGTTSWTIQNISLVEGENVITVTAKDSSGNTATDSITITCTVPSGTYTKTFGDSSDSDYTGTVQDTFLNINNDVNANTLTLNTYTWPTDRVANAIVMKWDLSALPTDAEIQNAILYLYLESSGGDDQYDVSVHKIINYDPNIAQCNGYTYDGTNGWTPNTQCYNNIPLAQADITQAEDTKAIDKNTGYKTWNVTQMVRDWVSDPSSNYGLLLNSDKTASADSYRYFTSTEVTDASRRPKLVITYTTVNPDTTPPTAPQNFSVE